MWVKVRASEAERAEWHAKARSAGLTLSDLVRRSVGRARTWTVAHAEVERERTRKLARIGNNLNQIAGWGNTHASEAEAVESSPTWPPRLPALVGEDRHQPRDGVEQAVHVDGVENAGFGGGEG